MNILIFGGTFNPVHNGHVNLCKTLRCKINADKVIIVPTYMPVHKDVNDSLISPIHRVNMCKIAFSQVGNCEINEIEIKNQKPCYTVDPLLYFKQLYKNDTLYFACGSDMFLSLDTWKDTNKLFSLAVFCAIPRTNEYDLMLKKGRELSKMGLEYKIFDVDYIETSSSKIRENLKEFKTDKNLDVKVLDYIISNGLYGV